MSSFSTPLSDAASRYRVITDAQLVLPSGDAAVGSLVIQNGRIADILSEPPAALMLNRDDVEWVSAQGYYVTPGLIDQHFHGGLGVDFNQSPVSDVVSLFAQLPAFGITAALPTILSAPIVEMVTAVNTVEQALHYQRPEQARILGIHLEGPFLNPNKRGAHPADGLQAGVQPDALMELQQLISPNLKLVTLAPEVDGDGSLTAFLAAQGIRVSAGHSAASYDQLVSAVRSGVSGITHLFNAMSAFHHREPGIAGFALTYDPVYVELIGDGVHVHPVGIQLALKAKPADKVILVSDCLALAGLPEGSSCEFAGQAVTVSSNTVLNEEGNLAGSAMFLPESVRNLVRWDILPFSQAIQLVTRNPAAYLGVDQLYGKIQRGHAADLVFWNPETLAVEQTWIAGQPVYRKDAGVPVYSV